MDFVYRDMFRSNMNFPIDSMETKKAVEECEAKLLEFEHPDPYIAPYMPGGTLFMRNPALPWGELDYVCFMSWGVVCIM